MFNRTRRKSLMIRSHSFVVVFFKDDFPQANPHTHNDHVYAPFVCVFTGGSANHEHLLNSDTKWISTTTVFFTRFDLAFEFVETFKKVMLRGF